MPDGDIEPVDQTVSSGEGELAVVRSGRVVVLDGPQAVIERLLANDPALRAARPVPSNAPAAAGALNALASLMDVPGSERTSGSMRSGPTVFQLDTAGQATFDPGGLSTIRDGFYRLFGKAADGTASGHGALKPVTMAPQQLAAAQLAVVTVALMAAIKEVQEAVERVEDKVDLLRDILDSERDGEIIGANRALRRRADHLGFDSVMSDTDWLAIDDVGVAVEQQIETLRSFIRKRVAAAEEAGRNISGRLDAVEHARDVAETLALLVVAQDSLFLYQQVRVLRIKATQPELAPAAADEARTLLDQHTDEDTDLLQRLRTLVAERVGVEALEVLRFRTASEIVQLAPQVNETLAWFADQRGLRYEPFEIPPLPGAAEVVDEVKERGAAIASGSKRAMGELRGWMRRRKRVADEAPALDEGEGPGALPSVTGDADQIDRGASHGTAASDIDPRRAGSMDEED